LEEALLTSFLPEFLLDHFEIVEFKQLGNISERNMEFEIHLDEKNQIHKDVSSLDYESKGFLPSSRVQDFPIRGKSVYLVFRRRRWRHKITKTEISNDFSFVAKGSKITEEISDFLKGTGRDPSRYDK
jgi:hypothetical protein|tara:strand:- start:421 stop:804 length:384 start_codon:yes stop_codon:yes gene_type:complete